MKNLSCQSSTKESHVNQIVEEKVLFYRIISTNNQGYHFVIPNEIIDLGNSFQWPLTS